MAHEGSGTQPEGFPATSKREAEILAPVYPRPLDTRALRSALPVTQPFKQRAAAALGAALHRADIVRDRRSDTGSPAAASAPDFVIAAVAHWRVPARSEYLLSTVASLRSLGKVVSTAITTNDANAVVATLRASGQDAMVIDSLDLAARTLIESPGTIVCVQWQPSRGTHPFRLTWEHKRLFEVITAKYHGFARGVTHLIYSEDDLEFAPNALRYWCAARPVLAPSGLIPGYTRIEGPPDDYRLTDQLEILEVADLPSAVLPWPLDGVTGEVRWVNRWNPYQAFYFLDEPLAKRHLATSYFRSPIRSLATPTQGRGWDIRARAAVGPLFDQVPSSFRSAAVIPLIPNLQTGTISPAAECLVIHIPCNYYSNPENKNATIPLHAGFRPLNS